MEALTESPGEELLVQCQSDVDSARRRAQALAAEAGLSEKASHELALVVSELGTNQLRHANGGAMTFRVIRSSTRTGLEIAAMDEGPGIPHVTHAFADGFSTSGGLGLGLGLVARLSDELDVVTDQAGTCVVIRKWQT